MVNNGDVHIEKPSDCLVAVFLMFGLCSHIRRVRLKAALHRMVSVRHQSTARVIRADETYAFEWLSRYFDILHGPFCAAPL